MRLDQIYYHLNEAVSGTQCVMELAFTMKGLPDDVILDIADKIYKDIHNGHRDWRKRAKQNIFRRKIDKIQEE